MGYRKNILGVDNFALLIYNRYGEEAEELARAYIEQLSLDTDYGFIDINDAFAIIHEIDPIDGQEFLQSKLSGRKMYRDREYESKTIKENIGMKIYDMEFINLYEFYDFLNTHYGEDAENVLQDAIEYGDVMVITQSVQEIFVSVDDAYEIMRQLDGEDGENLLQEHLMSEEDEEYF